MPRKTRARPVQITARFQIEAAAEGTQGRRFSLVAYSGETFRQWFCADPLVIDLDTLRLPQTLPILYDHRQDAEWVAGRADSVRIEGGRLLADGPVYESTEGGQTVLGLAAEGHVWQASVGADPASLDFVKAGEVANVNGRDYPGPVYVARGVDLREISFVVVGAAKNTSAIVARRIKGGNMDFETWVTSLGFDPNSLDAIQTANLQQLYNEEQGEEDDPADPPAADPATTAAADDNDDNEDDPMAMAASLPLRLRREAAAEISRQETVRRLCVNAGRPTMTVTTDGQRREVSVEARAVEEGWTAERTELELLRLRRPSMVDVVHGHDRDCTLQAMQGAMLLRAGGRLDHASYAGPRALSLGLPRWLRMGLNAEARQRAMEAAHRYADMSMVDVCREALRLAGREVPHGRQSLIQAAFSGGALTEIFTTSINAQLLATYEEAPDSTSGWVRERDVSDFKTVEDIRLKKGGSLTKHPRGATAAHMDRSDTKETYKIARYSGQLVVDEQDIIDDRMNAFQDFPREMGLGAARLRPDLVYSILKANAALQADSVALFHSSHANTDTSAALAADKLKAGVTAIRLQKENGVNLNLQPTHLVVPQTLEFTARELVQSTVMLIAGTAGSVTERGNLNTLTSVGLQVVADARLDNGVTDPSAEPPTAYSGDVNDWFLVAAQGYGIIVAYLTGTGRAPQSRSWVLDRGGQYGMGWDVNMDIGAKALDYRGLYRGVG